MPPQSGRSRSNSDESTVVVRRLRPLQFFALALSLAGVARADGQWTLEQSTLAYRVFHPLHDTEGISHSARGKAECREGRCDVLIAAPVKSFDSGDSNRDLHMIQAARGAQFPMVIVRIRLPESDFGSSTIHCDLEVEFAGQTARYRQVEFQQAVEGTRVRVRGTIPATLSDFKIAPPSLLTVAVKNDVPVRVESTWRRSEK
jgi:hypothetical protein